MDRSILFFLIICAFLCPVAAAADGSDPGLFLLKTRGAEIVNEAGDPVFLRGVNFGGWLSWEGVGFSLPPYTEGAVRKELLKRLDEKDVDWFFDSMRANIIGPEDFKVVKEMGLNFVRLPFHHRYTEGAGLEQLDRALAWAKEAGIYLLLDLQAAPGGQNTYQHSDHDGRARLWESAADQSAVIALWKRLAGRYGKEPAVLGYEIVNEPIAPKDASIISLYKRVIEAIRAIDGRHMIFLNDNHHDQDFSVFLPPPFGDNIVYVFHTYEPEAVTRERVADYLKLRSQYHVPIMCDEYGEFDFIGLFEAEKIPHAPWHYRLGRDNPKTPFYYRPSDHPWNLWLNKISETVEAGRDKINSAMKTAITTSRLPYNVKNELIKTIEDKGKITERDIQGLSRKYRGLGADARILSSRARELTTDAYFDAVASTIRSMDDGQRKTLMESLQTPHWGKGELTFLGERKPRRFERKRPSDADGDPPR